MHFPHIETSWDLLHIFKCLLGTAVRLLNWGLLLSLGLSMLRLLLGITLPTLACLPGLDTPNPVPDAARSHSLLPLVSFSA